MIPGPHHRVASLALALVPLAACRQVDPRPSFEEARRLVRESTGLNEVFDPLAPPVATAEVEDLLADGLTLDEARRLTLLNNRELQAEFQEIGIAHADWVQSRLLSNPSLDALVRFPTRAGGAVIEAALGLELLELWRVPVREEAARQALAATVLRIAHGAGQRLAETRRAYHAVVAAEALHELALENERLAARSFEAARELHRAGAADALDESLALGPLVAARLEQRRTSSTVASARSELARSLSIERAIDDLRLTDPLPAALEGEVDPETLVQSAFAARLDLRALAAGIEAGRARLRLERVRAWGDVSAGPAAERATAGGEDLVGATVGWTVPLFDQNQAQVARAGFELEQWIKAHESARIAIAQEVRAGAERWNRAARDLSFFDQEWRPRSEAALALARESYAAGQTSVLALIEAQRQILEARRSHVQLRLEAATAAADLERAVGVPR